MGTYIQILALVTVGIILLWIGYSLFLGPLSPFFPGFFPWRNWKKKGSDYKGQPGDPQVCPLCSIRLDRGELVKTLAFPSISGGADRLMYIRGCYSCINNNLPRQCPICGSGLSTNDYLISRMFERRHSKNHVHIIGCNQCKRTGSLVR